jgi:hypothetical protein
MNITKIVVIKTSGPLEVFVVTDLPNTQWPYNNELTMKFALSWDKYKEGYLEEHFPNVPITRILT